MPDKGEKADKGDGKRTGFAESEERRDRQPGHGKNDYRADVSSPPIILHSEIPFIFPCSAA